MSSATQADGDGFPRQREAVARRARALGAELVEEFADEGVSGTLPLAERPGLAALLARVLGNGVRLVLVEKADRLARDLVEGELILREFRRAGVRVVEAEGGQDLTAGDDSNPTAKLIRQVLGAVAEFEKAALVGKLRAARARVRQTTGRCEGVVPFGEDEDRPEEATVVAEIRRLRRRSPKTGQRRGYGEVADELNRRGRRTRKGGAWSRSSVRDILAR